MLVVGRGHEKMCLKGKALLKHEMLEVSFIFISAVDFAIVVVVVGA